MQKRKGLLLVIVLAAFTHFFYWKRLLPPFLTFSDSAKFADIARNLVLGRGYGLNFTYFGSKLPKMVNGLFNAGATPLYTGFLVLVFKILEVSDLAVIFTSGIFYLAGAITLYFLGKKVFGELVGILASLAFIFDPAMLDYATSGASESLFIFEIILAALLFYQNTRVSRFFGFLVLLLSYFTRPSAIIYIAGFVFLFILLRYKKNAQILKACGVALVVWLLIELVLTKFAGRFFLYSSLARFLGGTAKFSPTTASTAYLRVGEATLAPGLKPLLSKFFYNLYNFYKLLPQIFSPYLAGFYLLSLLRWEKLRKKRVFRGVVLFLVLTTFVATAATLPIFRYLHPVIPLIFLLAVEMLVWIVTKLVTSYQLLVTKKIKKDTLVFLVSLFLIFAFIIGQTMGKIFLDSRFIRAHTNPDKPPVYVQLSWILKENTNPDDLVITNLDTWGSWYGERRTVWFPLEPSQLVPEEGEEFKIDALYLTSYKIDDENYYMGENWRQIFYHPEKPEDPFLAKYFIFKQKFEIKAEETYEREGATAVLLIRR